MSEALTVREPTVLDKLLDDVGALKTIPVETVTELHRIHRIEVEDRRKVDYHAAFSRVQDALKDLPILKDSPGVHGSKYAKVEKLCAVLDPLLVAEGFSWSISDQESSLPGHVRVTMRLRRAGHEEEHYYNAPVEAARAGQSALQASGGTRTYSGRYLRVGVFGLHVVDDLDGANQAGAPTITPDQVADLAAAIQESRAPLAGVLASQGVERLEDLTAAGRKGVLYTLEQRRRLRGAKP